MERFAFLPRVHKVWYISPCYKRMLLIDGLLLVYLIYIYLLGGNWEAVITQDALRRFSRGAGMLMKGQCV